jgi:hypothetical protein
MQSRNEKLVAQLHELAREIETNDGRAESLIREAAARIEDLDRELTRAETEDREGWCGHCACQSCYDAKREYDRW